MANNKLTRPILNTEWGLVDIRSNKTLFTGHPNCVKSAERHQCVCARARARVLYRTAQSYPLREACVCWPVNTWHYQLAWCCAFSEGELSSVSRKRWRQLVSEVALRALSVEPGSNLIQFRSRKTVETEKNPLRFIRQWKRSFPGVIHSLLGTRSQKEPKNRRETFRSVLLTADGAVANETATTTDGDASRCSEDLKKAFAKVEFCSSSSEPARV